MGLYYKNIIHRYRYLRKLLLYFAMYRKGFPMKYKSVNILKQRIYSF